MRNIQEYNEKMEPMQMHQTLKRSLKLQKPSPIMKDIKDPNTNDTATEERTQTII